jgi:response regulator RpfG family c-di-GMP phosphodiesterase
MVFSLEHDIKVTKNHQNLLPTQSVLVAHTVFMARESIKILISATCFYNIAKIAEHKCVEDPL